MSPNKQPYRRIESIKKLQICDVSKYIDGKAILQKVAFDVKRGKIVGLLGPNGAGKTTLLRILLGLTPSDGGEALIARRLFMKLEAPLRTIGAVIENATLDPRLSARDNLRVYASAYSISYEKIDEMLQMTGLINIGSKPVKYYSLGMKKRLSIAVCLMTDPIFMVFDEPSNGLDPAGVAWLKQLLANLAHVQKKGVLVSSHMLTEMESILDEIVILNEGRILYTGSVEDLRSEGNTRVFAADLRTLFDALKREDYAPQIINSRSLEIVGDVRAEVGRIALAHSIPLQGLEFHGESLTSAYFRVLKHASQ